MAKKAKEQVDISDIFYDGAHDDAAKARMMKSSVWPVLVALYSFSEKQLQIGPVHYSNDSIGNLYHLLTRSGVPAAAVRHCGDTIDVMNADRMIHGSDIDNFYPYTPRISSDNPRYIVSKLNPSSNHEAKVCLNNAIKASRNAFSYVLRAALDGAVDVLAGRSVSKPSIRGLENEGMTALYDLAMGAVSKSDIDPVILAEITKVYDAHNVAMTQFVKDVDRAMDMLHSDKWVVANGVLGGLVVGAITSKNLINAYNTYKRNGTLPDYESHNYDEAVVPFKWYKSVEDMPEALRSELEASAVMLKAHTNSAGLIPELKHSSHSNNTCVWESVEAFGYNSWNTNGTDIVVFNK